MAYEGTGVESCGVGGCGHGFKSSCGLAIVVIIILLLIAMGILF